ncbi:hypothetical protein ccbrp13_12990 [Ktedonobacteria bacterium brp13]|nr:hypothetical protein ccbrp13_12990 [Ktedonobacteria bacterium brp13]
MTRLTDEEFHAWCHRNQIEPETATYIQRLRTASPERKVRGRASNVSGRYSICPAFSACRESWIQKKLEVLSTSGHRT